MKQFISHSLLLLLFAGLLSCKKDSTDYLDLPAAARPLYHVSFYDHKTGENITGIEAALIGISSNPLNGNIPSGGLTVKSDANGAFSFNPNMDGVYGNRYVKISTQTYVEALYAVNEQTDATSIPTHTKEGSGGPNVVFAKLLRKVGNDYYFSADLYRKAPIDLHIRQVSDYSDTLKAIFNADINGSDPSNTANNFGINDLLGEGFKLTPDKKMDTTIRVYAFGDYLNKVSWSVYRNALTNAGWSITTSKKFISNGNLEEKIFPSDTPTSITITF